MNAYLRDFYGVMSACGLNPPPWEAWLAHASDNADLWPIIKGGQLVGGVFFKAHSIHIAVLPQWWGRWLTPSIIRGYRQWKHDCQIVAYPPVENTKARTLAERLGFKYIDTTPNGLFAVYRKEPA